MDRFNIPIFLLLLFEMESGIWYNSIEYYGKNCNIHFQTLIGG